MRACVWGGGNFCYIICEGGSINVSNGQTGGGVRNVKFSQLTSFDPVNININYVILMKCKR